ncbi:hypothetical protein ASE00_06320 [Sphingomonas sp. Root710]|uniref:hypothetical protein n=1 Tax=Sphingomonas sp. Root710 TaxID=1736594 RepID=UPI0006F42C72|nr:hypothetical protein [Sphingomonas sp. Root710]KRB86329.1 hypothetical protein ASE00_06320 [Sphingomonas sp. Root710]
MNLSHQLAELLAGIERADAQARGHDGANGDRDHHAEAAQRADEAAEAGRKAARTLIEGAFPGISWSMIERASL